MQTAAESQLKLEQYNSKEIEILQRIFNFFGIDKFLLNSLNSATMTCPYDAAFSTDKGDFIVEMKCRNCTDKTYPTALIDVSKITEIMWRAERMGREALVFYSYSNSVVYIFTAAQIAKYPTVSKLANKRTFKSTTNKVEHLFYEFPTSIGKKIILP